MVKQSVAEKVIRVAERDIPIGGPTPPVKSGERLLRRTLSLCPECYRLLPAVVFERGGKVYIRRVCPDHGEIEEIYWGDYAFYEKAMKYEVPAMKIEPMVPMTAPCPFSCGLCPAHGDMTALANLVLTNRCDLECWYCFFYAERAGFVYEPTLEQIRQMIRVLRSEKPVPGLAVQLTGGEPTLRDDLVEIIKLIKEEGVKHIQLNTHGITFLKKPELMKQVREAGVNTMYLSFDGVSPKTNPKNHWEMPYILDIARESGMTSIVLVPTVIKGLNTGELGDIIRFAALNIDVVRGVNFQPISLTGRVPRSERERLRITIPEVIKLIEEQTEGQIPMDAWYPVPFVTFISDLVEALTGKPQFRMTNHPACGAATYVFPEYEHVDGSRVIKRFVPITEFIDVEGFREYVLEKVEELRSGANRWITALKIVANLSRFIDKSKQPEGVNVLGLIRQILLRRDYAALGEFHYKSLFLGMMHFMDLYNYDVQRVMRCNIHYLVPDGRVIPFCTFNVLSDLYRDYVQKKFGISLEEYARTRGVHLIGPESKYRRDAKALESGEAYKRTYAPFVHLWKES
ncbi:MAG TPA: radical SAM protein [Candidatus Korarchaeota archaeon]|nr:radical SAM protein [Candidatus Korarchaeota archaeon]